MAVEYTANAIQTVAVNQNVIFTDSPIPCNKGLVLHTNNSGIITLRGITNNQCRVRYRISFTGNTAVSVTGTLAPISIAIALNGETIANSVMIVTPATIGDYFNVSTDVFVDIPKCCCYTLSVKNISATAINIQNANIVIDRVA